MTSHQAIAPIDPGEQEERTAGLLSMCLLALLVGVVAGIGAAAFRAIIAVLHNLFFLGKFSSVYNANIHTPSGPWGPYIILVPVVGAVGVVFLVKNFAPEAKGHGVPEVIDAVFHRRGVIRPIVSVVKAFASALSIASGGSVGREGPIIQIGSSFGSTLGQLLRLPPWQKATLIAAGAGGGIAATFNTPLGGILFALEIVMPEVSARTLVPVIMATATATYLGRIFFGQHPSFYIPVLETVYFHSTNPIVLLAYALLGILAGLVSALFIKSIYSFEHFFENRVKGGYYVQHVLGMLVVGLMMYVFLSKAGNYYIEGVGYATIQDLLTSVQLPLYFIAVLFAAKLLATCLTLGSGASGGVFSPALFLGATMGAAYGIALHKLFPALDIATPAFAIVGMAGVVGGATGAALAAIVMIFEMTLDYTIIIPLTLTVALSYVVRRRLIQDSIYTRKLALRGELAPDSLRADLQFSRRAASVMNADLVFVSAVTPISHVEVQEHQMLLVLDAADGVEGAVSGEEFRLLASGNATRTIGDVVQQNYVVVSPDDSIWTVVAGMRSRNAEVTLVAVNGAALEARNVYGVISLRLILNVLALDMELFGVQVHSSASQMPGQR